MASLNMTIDASKLLKQLHIEVDNVLIERLGQLLHLSPDDARDWLICKVAQFRGVSEADVASWLHHSTLTEAPVPDMQSQARGMTVPQWQAKIAGAK